MSRRVLVSHKLPVLRSGNPEIDRWVEQYLQRHVAEVFEQFKFLTPEYGDFTPAVSGSGTPGTYELSTAVGRYYKHADLIFVSIYIIFAGAVTGGGTGNLQITGLPYATAAPAVRMYPTGSVVLSGVDIAAATVSLAPGFTSSTSASSTLVIQETNDNAANSVVQIGSVAANDNIIVTIIYEAGDRAA